MNLRHSIKRFLPPALTDALQSAAGRRNAFRGPFDTWALANARARGYDASRILEQVAAATEQVTSGVARYERDGVLFDRIDFSYPVLAALLKPPASDKETSVFSISEGRWAVRTESAALFSRSSEKLNWLIVEQHHYVEHALPATCVPMNCHSSKRIDDAVSGKRPDVGSPLQRTALSAGSISVAWRNWRPSSLRSSSSIGQS
jgi:hypothetical protein